MSFAACFPQCSEAALPEWGGASPSLPPHISGAGPTEGPAVGGGETEESCVGDSAGTSQREDSGQENGGYVTIFLSHILCGYVVRHILGMWVISHIDGTNAFLRACYFDKSVCIACLGYAWKSKSL